mgnify:FL=1
MAGEWAKFVADNKAADKRISEKKIFPEQQINKYANKIVDKSYQQTKNKNPFTQSAEVAKDLLSFELKDGFIENKDNKRVDTVKEAVEMNEALDKNVLDHKKDDYLKLIESNRLAESESPKQTWNRLEANEKKRLHKLREKDELDKMVHFGIENSSVKHPDYPRAAPKPRLTNEQRRMMHYEKAWDVKNPKLAELPIIKQNINHQKMHNQDLKNNMKKWISDADEAVKRNNPTVNKYKQFKEDQKMKAEEKKFNEEFEKEYGTKAIEKDLRDKENANRRAGRAPHEGFSSSQQIVAEHAKDRARKILKALTTDPIKIEPTYIDYRLSFKDTEPRISLEEHLAKTAPIEDDPAGITGLSEVKNFRNIIDMTDQKFPKQARGIGPFISGEDDAI